MGAGPEKTVYMHASSTLDAAKKLRRKQKKLSKTPVIIITLETAGAPAYPPDKLKAVRPQRFAEKHKAFADMIG